MTREEQLDWLCRLRSEIYVYMPKEWLIPMNNALDMAISALEHTWSGDAISRDVTLDAIRRISLGQTDVVRVSMMLEEYVKHLPSVTHKSGKCKTCKYWQDNNNGYPSDMCKWRTDETPDADDFCSEYEPQECKELFEFK